MASPSYTGRVQSTAPNFRIANSTPATMPMPHGRRPDTPRLSLAPNPLLARAAARFDAEQKAAMSGPHSNGIGVGP